MYNLVLLFRFFYHFHYSIVVKCIHIRHEIRDTEHRYGRQWTIITCIVDTIKIKRTLSIIIKSATINMFQWICRACNEHKSACNAQILLLGVCVCVREAATTKMNMKCSSASFQLRMCERIKWPFLRTLNTAYMFVWPVSIFRCVTP